MLTKAVDEYKVRPEEDEDIIQIARERIEKYKK
jgi:hypothetical protein